MRSLTRWRRRGVVELKFCLDVASGNVLAGIDAPGRRLINMSRQWLPKGFHTITPNIIVDDAEQAVAFLKKAFGATENYRLTMSNGKIAHCELALGDSILNLGTSMEGWPAHGLVAQIFVEDSDALFQRALEAGATAIMPMTDMFFGSRAHSCTAGRTTRMMRAIKLIS
jgi:PhnB protein